MTDSKHIFDEYMLVACANHYLVRVATESLTWDELCAAEHLLISVENATPESKRKVVSLALDMCERDAKEKARVS